MTNLTTQLAFGSLGIILTSSIVYLKPAQAAVFNITLDPENAPLYAELEGKLKFDWEKTKLTGFGFEQASLSQLPDANFNFKYVVNIPEVEDRVSNFNLSEPTFYFNFGNLVGIDIDGEANGAVPSSYPPNYLGEFAQFYGTVTFSIRGDSVTQLTDGSVSYLLIATDEAGDLIGGELISENLDNYQSEGKVLFEAVPEPITILGAATAIGFSLFFKRKQTKK